VKVIEPVAVVALLLAIVAAPAAAQVRYKDDEGVTHFVDSINDVPEKYRSGAIGGPSPKGQPSGIDWNQEWKRRSTEREQRERSQAAQENVRALTESWERDAKICVDAVADSGVFGADRFNAYISGPGAVEMVGSAQARYEFRRCMVGKGHVLK
jgi:hypothetical protein